MTSNMYCLAADRYHELFLGSSTALALRHLEAYLRQLLDPGTTDDRTIIDLLMKASAAAQSWS